MRPPRSYPLLAEPRPAVRFFLLGSALSISLTSSLRPLHASARGLIMLLDDPTSASKGAIRAHPRGRLGELI